MRLHRFYILETIGSKNVIILDSVDVVHQIRKVFRLKKGNLLIIFDGSGSDYTCGIEDFRDETIVLGVREVSKSRFMPERDVYLYAALVKKDTFEWIVEKATELGVTKIIPILAERTEKKAVNEERLKKIVIEASEQSGRGSVPEIAAVISLKEAVVELQAKNESLDTRVRMLSFHTDAELFTRVDLGEVEPLACFIGPEGGWSPDEIDLFHKNKIPVKSIGDQVLRAETAVVATLSLVMFGK
ncbi:MAG: RsmE family RNA methyltransferase [Candidatus Pacebacteria bacterium]|nr:RsmE family RNA methyltransferase [Candidatus Paceibacterota bacterium]